MSEQANDHKEPTDWSKQKVEDPPASSMGFILQYISKMDVVVKSLLKVYTLWCVQLSGYGHWSKTLVFLISKENESIGVFLGQNTPTSRATERFHLTSSQERAGQQPQGTDRLVKAKVKVHKQQNPRGCNAWMR